MDLGRLTSFLGKDWTLVNECIGTTLDTDVRLLAQTNDFILSHHGKMLRPIIALLVARSLSRSEAGDNCVKYAAAVEILHNATLLHDDVVDGSDERHGAATVSSVLGGTASVLVGDFWLARAVKLIVTASGMDEEVLGIFAKTLSDLAEGEMFQLQKASAADTTEEDYYKIIYKKTASVFEASTVAAAMSVGASKEALEAAREYGRNLGMAFQIKDDIMDFDSTDDIGKPTGLDIMEQKITLPLLGALANSDESAGRNIRRAVSLINEHPEGCDAVKKFVYDNDGISYAKRKLDEFVAKAKAALRDFPEGPDRDYLEKLAEYTAYRKI